jgi:tetraacyldisaccharide 4'-kinase
VVVLSRADAVSAADRAKIRQQALGQAAGATWAEIAHVPQTLLSAHGAEQPISTLAGREVAAFCGIGNPAGFRHTLVACGYAVAGFREFPDHYIYSEADVQSLATWAAGLGAAALICTQKDLVKLRNHRPGTVPLWAITIGLEFLAGQADLESRLDALVPRRASASSGSVTS